MTVLLTNVDSNTHRIEKEWFVRLLFGDGISRYIVQKRSMFNNSKIPNHLTNILTTTLNKSLLHHFIIKTLLYS